MLVANSLLGMAGGIQYLKLKSATKNPRKSSEKTLRAILEYAKDTEYGKEHNFAEILKAKTAEELFSKYHENVPRNDYEDLRPYVEKHKLGNANILFPGKPILYATTSGTTSEPKWIPITQEYLSNIYGKMIIAGGHAFLPFSMSLLLHVLGVTVLKDLSDFEGDSLAGRKVKERSSIGKIYTLSLFFMSVSAVGFLLTPLKAAVLLPVSSLFVLLISLCLSRKDFELKIYGRMILATGIAAVVALIVLMLA